MYTIDKKIPRYQWSPIKIVLTEVSIGSQICKNNDAKIRNRLVCIEVKSGFIVFPWLASPSSPSSFSSFISSYDGRFDAELSRLHSLKWIAGLSECYRNTTIERWLGQIMRLTSSRLSSLNLIRGESIPLFLPISECTRMRVSRQTRVSNGALYVSRFLNFAERRDEEKYQSTTNQVPMELEITRK